MTLRKSVLRGRLLAVAGAVLLGGMSARPAAAQETVEYYALDAIGSVRAVFDANGNVTARLDFDPFGRELSSSANAPDRKFAGLFRDGEAGLDYAQARSYQVRTGRFGAPDPIYGRLFDPQTLNRYNYSNNRPTTLTDPTGLAAGDCQPGSTAMFCTQNNPVTQGSGTATGLSTAGVSSMFDAWWWDGFLWRMGLYIFPRSIRVPRDETAGNSSSEQTTGGSTTTTDTGSAPGAPPPGNCPQTPPGTPSKYCGPLQEGLDAAKKALQKKNCRIFFEEQGPQALDDTTYRFLDLKNSTTGAATIDVHTVFINSNGPYINYAPTVGQAGPFGRYWTQSQFRGFILLHELGHQLSPITGFKSDAGNLSLNQAQSRSVIGACF